MRAQIRSSLETYRGLHLHLRITYPPTWDKIQERCTYLTRWENLFPLVATFANIASSLTLLFSLVGYIPFTA